MPSSKVLITGGTGLVGRQLTDYLVQEGYEVAWLSRRPSDDAPVTVFTWDYSNDTIQPEALDWPDHIVHLAGAGIGDKKWTADRKRVLSDSRIKSAEFLFSKFADNGNLKSFVSASAIGYYGYDTGSRWMKEGSRFGDDFLATLTKEWEAAADKFQEKDIRTVKLRIGMVLSPGGGLLGKLKPVFKAGLGAALGSGQQYISWVHVEDLSSMFMMAIGDESMSGPYNATSPEPMTNKEFSRLLARRLKRPFILPNVPKFVLKIMFGEFASSVTGGNRVSPDKILDAGFEFRYPSLKKALDSLSL